MKNNKMCEKLRLLRFCRLFVVAAFCFFAVFVVGLNSDYLINTFLKFIALFGTIFCYILYIYYIFKYVNTKGTIRLISKVGNIFTVGFCVLVVGVLNVIYGNNMEFKDWYVTTSMATMKHQFLSKMFYSEDTISAVLDRNTIEEVIEDVDTSLINIPKNDTTLVSNYDESIDKLVGVASRFVNSEEVVNEENEEKVLEVIDSDALEDYENIYEYNIFNNHTSDEKYRMIRLTVNKKDAYLAIVYDPSALSVAVTKGLGKTGEYVTSMAKRNNAYVAVNGGRFKDAGGKGSGGLPTGVTISNNKIISNRNYSSKFGVIGINQDNILVLYKGIDANEALDNGIRDAVTSGPFLIVNGKSSITKGNGGYGYDARTVIGQRADGIMLLLVVDANDTRTSGASMVNVMNVMKEYGAVNAAALDGGTSSVMVEKGVLISDPINSKMQHKTRPIATAWIAT